jgi:cellulose synthase operon protein YhjQ
LGGVDEADVDGISAMGAAQMPLKDAVFVSPFGVDFIPYGTVDEPHRKAFEHYLVKDANWLMAMLTQAGLPANSVVLLDTPPGPNVYLKQALRASSFALELVLADSASYATVSAMELLIEDYTYGNSGFIGTSFMLNQGGEQQQALMIASALRERYGQRVMPDMIRRSNDVEDALAFERPLLQYSPECDAAMDMQRMVDWVLKRLL